jgi:DNA transformation protein
MLLENGVRPHFIGYYVLVMGLQNRPWNDCKGAEKQALRQRFDHIKVQAKQRARDSGVSHELDRALDQIGVRKPSLAK